MINKELLPLSKKIREIRKNNKISQLNLSIKANIDRKTISRIENGMNEPSILTLYKISNALDYDFIKEYIDIYFNDYVIFKNSFEILIEKLEHNIDIKKELKIISSLNEKTSIEFIKNSCNQVLLFIKSLETNLTKFEQRKYLKEALNCFEIKSKNFTKNSYTNFELRILMDIAMTYTNIDNNKYLYLLKFVYEKTSVDNSLFPIISINLANAYIIIEKYDDCLEIVNHAIKNSLDRNHIPNPILYFTRYISKRLNGIECIKDYKKAILIASLAENHQLIEFFETIKSSHDEIKE